MKNHYQMNQVCLAIYTPIGMIVYQNPTTSFAGVEFYLINKSGEVSLEGTFEPEEFLLEF